MESYKDQENTGGNELILPVVIEAGSLICINDILRVIPRALIKYFDKEHYDDGLIPEQDFLEWLSDGGIVDLRVNDNGKYEKSSDHVSIECLGHLLSIEPVYLAEKPPANLLNLEKYFAGKESIKENVPSLDFEPFKIPLASIVASPASHNSSEELLNQVCFTVGSIFFSLQEDEIKEWRENDFRVEVFLENDININSNTRVLTTIEETGRIASTGFWID